MHFKQYDRAPLTYLAHKNYRVSSNSSSEGTKHRAWPDRLGGWYGGIGISCWKQTRHWLTWSVPPRTQLNAPDQGLNPEPFVLKKSALTMTPTCLPQQNNGKDLIKRWYYNKVHDCTNMNFKTKLFLTHLWPSNLASFHYNLWLGTKQCRIP